MRVLEGVAVVLITGLLVFGVTEHLRVKRELSVAYQQINYLGNVCR